MMAVTVSRFLQIGLAVIVLGELAWSPNLARVFVDFLLSKPAQQRLRSSRRIPARADIEPFSPLMEQSKLNLVTNPVETGAQFNASIKDFREIFGH